jgi:ATP-dependent Clp protease ATP-binding subunit ClpA
VDEKLGAKMARSGADAARRKFTPEFINRLDKIVTFKPLGTNELRKILDIELNMVQQRIFNTSPEKSFVFKTTDGARDFLLKEGTDLKYGARHLKRAIERLLVQPMSNLIATDQVRGGDCVNVDFDSEACALNFIKEAEGLAVNAMADLVDRSISIPAFAMANGAFIESAKSQSARSSKRA